MVESKTAIDRSHQTTEVSETRRMSQIPISSIVIERSRSDTMAGAAVGLPPNGLPNISKTSNQPTRIRVRLPQKRPELDRRRDQPCYQRNKTTQRLCEKARTSSPICAPLGRDASARTHLSVTMFRGGG